MYVRKAVDIWAVFRVGPLHALGLWTLLPFARTYKFPKRHVNRVKPLRPPGVDGVFVILLEAAQNPPTSKGGALFCLCLCVICSGRFPTIGPCSRVHGITRSLC